jgi:hypothetical protein
LFELRVNAGRPTTAPILPFNLSRPANRGKRGANPCCRPA